MRTLLALTLITATAMADESSEAWNLRGETTYGPGAKVPTTSIHIFTRPDAKQPKPKPNNENPPKAQYDEECHKWVQMASYSGKGYGQWRDHGGTLHKGEWSCTATTMLVYNNRLGLNAQCIRAHDAYKDIDIRVSWRADVVVVDDKKVKKSCKVKSGKGQTNFLTAIKDNKGLRPVKKQGKKPMEIGKKRMRLRLPADGGKYFTLDLTNDAYDPYGHWK